jgi:hypothetical protein
MSSPLYGVGLPQEARARVLAKIRCAVVGPDWVRLGAVHVKCRVMNLTQFADLDILYKDHDREVYERLRDADNSDPVNEYENGATDFLCNHEVEAERWDPYWNDDGMEGWDGGWLGVLQDEKDEELLTQYESTHIGDFGGRALGAALLSSTMGLRGGDSIDHAHMNIYAIELSGCGLSAEGIVPIVEALVGLSMPILAQILVDGNPLGDVGLQALATALPASLSLLDVSRTSCGDDGLRAIAMSLCTTAVQYFELSNNPGIAKDGWRALGMALPRLPNLQRLSMQGCMGMGCVGAVAFAAGLPGAQAALHDVHCHRCGIGAVGRKAFEEAAEQCVPNRQGAVKILEHAQWDGISATDDDLHIIIASDELGSQDLLMLDADANETWCEEEILEDDDFDDFDE